MKQLTWQRLEFELIDAARRQGLWVRNIDLAVGSRGDWYVFKRDGSKVVNLTQLAHDLLDTLGKLNE